MSLNKHEIDKAVEAWNQICNLREREIHSLSLREAQEECARLNLALLAARDEAKRLRAALEAIIDVTGADLPAAQHEWTMRRISGEALHALYPVTVAPARPITDEELTRRAEAELREGIWDATHGEYKA